MMVAHKSFMLIETSAFAAGIPLVSSTPQTQHRTQPLWTRWAGEFYLVRALPLLLKGYTLPMAMLRASVSTCMDTMQAVDSMPMGLP